MNCNFDPEKFAFRIVTDEIIANIGFINCKKINKTPAIIINEI
jgi:hypothetical protein